MGTRLPGGNNVRERVAAFRRTIVIGAVWTVAMLAAALAAPGTAAGQEAVDPGRGLAYAQGYKLDPRNGGLSFGVTYGMSLSGHQNTLAVGEARSLDLGVIGTTLAAKGCDGGDPTLPREDQPQPLVVRSTEEGSEEGRSESELGVERHAKASSMPAAEAVAVTAAAGDPAAAHIGSTVSTTRSGVIDGNRVATAITDVSSISLGAGQVVLRGLRWEASWQSAPEEATSGSFTIEGIEIAGEKVPIEGGDGIQALSEANPVLEPLGIFIDPPSIREKSGIVFVDPLRIGIEPSETRQGVTGPILGAGEDGRSALVQALLDIDCSFGSLITVGDVVLGSMTGAGSLNIELGGVTAQSDEIKGTSFLGTLSAPPPGVAPVPSLTPAPLDTSTGSGLGATGSTGATTPPTPQTTDGVDTEEAAAGAENAAATTEMIAGTRGGPLVWIGLAGLGLLGVLAELDRRRMRKAQRTMPMELS